MTREVQDRYLPPDHDAFVAAEPPTGRVIVIAPTRAACETIELALSLHIDTFLERTRGAEIRDLAASGRGFGIVAGTGTGKTLAIRPIAETILRTTELKVGVVNREREATPETPTWNVIIVTTGIARRWFQDGDILASDTLVVDEIHQTSAELELCLALGKRVGCKFVWLSATVDPTFYRNYLDSADVLEVYAFDPAKAAKVRVVNEEPLQFLSDRFLQQLYKQRRGVALFVPTRAGVEQAAKMVQERWPRINTAFYHGGEPIRVIRAFLEGDEKKPYFLAMTAAGQSALNVQGLDTVIIDDTRFTNVVEEGKNVLTRLHLGANEILQMAGRVHGRAEDGRVFILSDRDIDFFSLQPTAPEFQLAGDSERVALTCADIGVDVKELELPVPLDRQSYHEAVAKLEGRHIIENGRLTQYGKSVEALPCDRAWAELIVNADDELVPYLAVMSSIESLHRMTREDRDLDGLVVPGSDHLTAYNIYAEAYSVSGYLGEVYGLPRHLFDEKQIEEWAERRGVLVKAIEDAALAMASVCRAVKLPLPQEMPNAGESIKQKFAELLAQYMPFDLVIDEETAEGEEARVSKTSVCGSWGAIAGELRWFADKMGIARAAIEGTQIPMGLVHMYATRDPAEVVFDAKGGRRGGGSLALRRRVTYYGFELEREVEALDESFSDEVVAEARRVLARALATEEARHPAVERNRPIVAEIRELYRRSGGKTRRLGLDDLTALYESELADVKSLDDFRRARPVIRVEDFVSEEERARLMELPDRVEIRGKDVEVQYDVEKTGESNSKSDVLGIVRLRLPEKMGRTLAASEVPSFDRPVRFVVTRGPRGAVRASSIEELQELLDRPWSPDEVEGESADRAQRKSEERARRHRERAMREVSREFSSRSRSGSGSRSRSGSRGESGRSSLDRERGGRFAKKRGGPRGRNTLGAASGDRGNGGGPVRGRGAASGRGRDQAPGRDRERNRDRVTGGAHVKRTSNRRVKAEPDRRLSNAELEDQELRKLGASSSSESGASGKERRHGRRVDRRSGERRD